MNTDKKLNMTMLCDFYELTMGNGYFQSGYKDRITYFDVFFRTVPDNGGFAIAAGLEQAIEYVQQLHFDEDDIAYLRSRKMFDEGFLQYLRSFRFTVRPASTGRCRARAASASTGTMPSGGSAGASTRSRTASMPRPPRCKRPCASTSGTATAGCGRWTATGWAASSPMIWVWARRCRC